MAGSSQRPPGQPKPGRAPLIFEPGAPAVASAPFAWLSWTLGLLSAVVLAPLAALALLVRPAWRVGLAERLGERPPEVERGGVWLHAASVGEGLAARRLIEGLRSLGHPVHISSTTVSGRDVMRRSITDPTCALAPIDHPICVARAMRAVDPALLVLIETELWPVLIAGAARRGAAVVLVSGRLSDRSFRRYRALRVLLGPTLRRLHHVGARSAEDAERFVALGVPRERVSLTGDLKLDPPDAAPVADEALCQQLGAVPIAVAGSTHPGEEAAALEALAACEAAGRALALVIAPRRAERFDEVARLLESTGRSIRRRSESGDPTPLGAGEILLLDSLGELASVYGYAAVSFVGGTLAPIGGHNLLEPVQAGSAVCFGPHVENWREVVDVLEESGAGLGVRDGSTLGAAWCELLADGASRRRAQAGLRALEAHRGSVVRSMEVVRGALGEASSGAR